MLRIAGCTLILSGSLLLRREILRPSLQEIRTMRELAAALRLLEQEVALTLLPLPKLLERAQNDFFRTVAKRVKGGQSFAESWRAEAQELALQSEVKGHFVNFGGQLAGEEESVRRTLLCMAQMLDEAASCQQAEMRERRRLTNVLCLSGGTLACILLL